MVKDIERRMYNGKNDNRNVLDSVNFVTNMCRFIDRYINNYVQREVDY